MSELRISTFRCDVTPPIGHPLCAGWYGPAVAIADPLQAIGVVLSGPHPPVVLCALDWAEISNLSHLHWRQRLAEAAGTDPDRVAVQCTHAHCTPWPDVHAQQWVEPFDDIPQVMDTAWCDAAIDRVADAVRSCMHETQPITHVGIGQSPVHRIASNRRIMGPEGKVKAVRYTFTRDLETRAEPEGLIDPNLRTVSFWQDDEALAAMHYYAVHPTSYDRDQTVTPEFVGLARQRLQQQTPQTHQMYFTGCAGNITAGKYNDGTPQSRAEMTDRIFQAMHDSLQHTDRFAANSFDWSVENVSLPPRDDMTESALLHALNDKSVSPLNRNRSAIKLAYLNRCDTPIPLTCLTLADRIKILHLPGEPFIEYQLHAQLMAHRHSVAVAGYGDCGPGYICLERSAAEGGYEPTDSFVADPSEQIMRDAIQRLVGSA